MSDAREVLARTVTPGEVVELARRLVAIPSHPRHPGKERELAEYLAGFATTEGLEARLQDVTPGRPNLVVTVPGRGGGKSLMLNAHLDTVPPHAMVIDPFTAAADEGRIFGLGAADTKGGLAAMAMALVGLARAGVSLAGDVVLTAVIDEEGRGEGTEAVLGSGLRADGAIVAEPTGLKVCPGHKGLEWLEVTVHGRAVHSGRKEEGESAISRAARLITAVEETLVPKLAERAHPFLGPPTLNFGLIHGGTQPSTVAGSCVIQLDRRTVPAENRETVCADFREVFGRLSRQDPGFRADIARMPEGQATMDHLAFVTDPEHPLVRAVAEAVQTVTGEPAQLAPFPAWSDAGFLAVHGGIPAVVFGPGDISQAHCPAEWLATSQLLRATQVYALTAVAYCGPAARR